MKTLLSCIVLVIFTCTWSMAQNANYDLMIDQAIANKDTATAVKHLLKKIEHSNTDSLEGLSALVINNQIFNFLFKFSHNKRELLSAANLMGKIVVDKHDKEQIAKGTFPTFIDTYANLLYKAGEKRLAIKWEQRGLDFAPEPEKQEFIDNLGKMKQGLSTW